MAGQNTEPLTYLVGVKAAWGDAWTIDESIDVDRVEFALGPKGGRAQLARRHGFLVATGAESRGVQPPADLRGQYVRVQLVHDGDAVSWYGVVVDPETEVWRDAANPDTGAPVQSGITRYACEDLGWWLRTQPLRHATTTAGRLAMPLVANPVIMGRREGNRSAALVADHYVFAAADWAGTPWTALDLAQYLLAEANAELGTRYTIAGQTAPLERVVESWDFRGRTYWQALTDLLSPGYGVAWYIDGWELTVRTLVGAALVYGGDTYIEANQDQILVYPAATDRINCRIVEAESARYSAVRVEGEPVRAVFSMSIVAGTLAAGWTAGDAAEYAAALAANAPPPPDNRAYRDYVLPAGWDGEAGGNPVMLEVDPATGAITGSSQTVWTDDLRVRPRIPRWAIGRAEEPMLLIGASGGGYYDLRREYLGVGPVAVRPLPDQLGVTIRTPKAPHYVAAGDGLPDAVLDWEDLIATVAIDTHEPLHVELAVPVPAGQTEIARTKLIRVPHATAWYWVGGTVRGVDPDDSTTLLTVAPAGAVTQSDAAYLLDLARLAVAWYGRQRSTLALSIREPAVLDYLGYWLTAVDTGAGVTPVGSIVSRIVYTLGNAGPGNPGVELATAWYDVDLRRLSARVPDFDEWRRRIEGGDYSWAVDNPAAIGSNAISTSQWLPVAPTTYTPTPASTSRLTMSDTTGMTVQMPLRYEIGGTEYYGIVAAVSADTYIDVYGAPLSGSVSALARGPEQLHTVSLLVNGAYDYAGAGLDMLQNVCGWQWKWDGAPARIVWFEARQSTPAVTAQPKVNLYTSGGPGYVSTADSNNGIQLSGTAWTGNSAVAIAPTHAAVAAGDAISAICTAVGNAQYEASDLAINVVMVFE